MQAEHGGENLAADEHEDDEDPVLGRGEGLHFDNGHDRNGGGGDRHEEEVQVLRLTLLSVAIRPENPNREEAERRNYKEVTDLNKEWVAAEEEEVVEEAQRTP